MKVAIHTSEDIIYWIFPCSLQAFFWSWVGRWGRVGELVGIISSLLFALEFWRSICHLRHIQQLLANLHSCL